MKLRDFLNPEEVKELETDVTETDDKTDVTETDDKTDVTETDDITNDEDDE